MGMNIVVEDFGKKDKYGCYVEAPEWDSIRYSGDSAIVGVLCSFGTEYKNEGGCNYMRPIDFSNLRIAVGAFENHIGVNKGRWLNLIKLLEAHSDYWVYFSY